MLQDFLKPRLVGDRFEEHSLPVDVLKDWAAFEELVIEVAKDLYLKDHPDRKRAPRGFADDFNLHLSSVEAGSAIPVLKRRTVGDKLPFADHFDKALGVIQATIVAVNLGLPVPVNFPRDYLGYFNRFGSSLREGERIEWTAPGASTPAIYDRNTRKKLVLTGAKSYQAAADLRGWIVELNAENNSFTIKLISGPKIVGKYPQELAASVLAAVGEFQAGKFQSCKVLVRGMADYDLNDQPIIIGETQHIELLDPNDVTSRCEELAQLRDGWLDGAGKAPSRDGIKAFKTAWMAASTEKLPLPYIYPTAEGGIQLEWRQDEWEISAEIELENLNADLLAVNVSSRAQHQLDVVLTSPHAWEKLTTFVINPETPFVTEA